MGENTLDAVWCINAETREEVLIDRSTNRIIAVKDKDGVIREVDWRGF